MIKQKVKRIYEHILSTGYKTGDCYAHDFIERSKEMAEYRIREEFHLKEIEQGINYLKEL
jgi:hypothetical protein